MLKIGNDLGFRLFEDVSHYDKLNITVYDNNVYYDVVKEEVFENVYLKVTLYSHKEYKIVVGEVYNNKDEVLEIGFFEEGIDFNSMVLFESYKLFEE